MDRLWKEDEGLDLRLNVYNCLSTGVNEGLIEVVSQAETVCKIQMKQADAFVLKATSAALNKGCVLAWLKRLMDNFNSDLEIYFELRDFNCSRKFLFTPKMV